jgi:hypothetical protein
MAFPWFDKNDLWGSIAKVQKKDREYEQKKKEDEEKATGGSARGFKAGDVSGYKPGVLWRATDFWREGMFRTPKMNIRQFLKKNLDKTDRQFQQIQQAYDNKNLPANFFIDVTDWFWFVKEDGYLVKLIRNENTNKWSMFTRKNNDMMPPPGFLEGLEKNKELPSLMIGELVTCFNGCESAARGDTGLRTVLRNKQFATLNLVQPKGQFAKPRDPRLWVGLRVKVFAFPNNDMEIWKTYEKYSQVMAKTLDYHPHIGLCRAARLDNTEHAIKIFNIVVQMGLEGIVIVNPEVKYGTEFQRLPNDDKIGTYFKLKQKIVENYTAFTQGDRKDVYKDGELETVTEFTIKNFKGKQDVKFMDSQDRRSSFARIKYMEHAPGFSGFPCISGYRHMHFATEYDMSVEVPAAEKLTDDSSIRNMLGVDNDSNNILNWEIDEDKEKLKHSSRSIRLFNPQPFELKTAANDDSQSADRHDSKRPSEDTGDEDMGGRAQRPPKRSSSGVFPKKNEPTRKPSRQASGVWERWERKSQYTVEHNHDSESSKAARSKDKGSAEKEWWKSSDSE